MKTCNRCGEDKELDEFHVDRASGDGRQRKCRPCLLATQREWREKNRSLHRSYVSDYNKTHPDWRRAGYLKSMYGITHDRYEKILKTQDGLCAICRRPNQGDKRLGVDHCHTSGRVRGLLCNCCNTILGMAEDEPGRLREAAAYLEKLIDLRVD